jgi:hypothetical protein
MATIADATTATTTAYSIRFCPLQSFLILRFTVPAPYVLQLILAPLSRNLRANIHRAFMNAVLPHKPLLSAEMYSQ